MARKISLITVLTALFAFFSTTALLAQSGKGLRTVVIDPGHGGHDPGALGLHKSSTNYHEKTVVLNISLLLGEKIKAAYPDVKVIYTRDKDVFVKRGERARIANAHADLFISVHCNGSDDLTARGASVYVLGPKSTNPENKKDYFQSNRDAAKSKNVIARLEEDGNVASGKADSADPSGHISSALQWKAIHECSLMFAMDVVDNLIKDPLLPHGNIIHQGVYDVLAYTTRPAVLLELAFMTNKKDFEYLRSSEGQEEIAERLFKAFVSYKTKYDASFNISFSSDLEAQVEIDDDEPYYAIQIMSGSRMLSSSDSAFKGYDAVGVKSADSNIYKYIIGMYASKEEACNELSEVRKLFPDAFVVKVDGDIVSRP